MLTGWLKKTRLNLSAAEIERMEQFISVTRKLPVNFSHSPIALGLEGGNLMYQSGFIVILPFQQCRANTSIRVSALLSQLAWGGVG